MRLLPFLHLFSLRVPTYALFVALGAALGLSLFFLRLPKGTARAAARWTAAVAAGALLGAKLLYLATMPRGTPLSSALLTGFVFHGGLLGGALIGLLAARALRLDVLMLMDHAAPCLAIGHGIGRVGCFFAGCCYGVPVPWGIVLPQALAAPRDVPLLPVQLIEAALNVTLGVALLRYARKEREPGYTAGLYCLSYAVLRFCLEFFRGDEVRGAAAGLSTGQWMSLALLAAGLTLFARVCTADLELQNTRLVLRLRPLSCPLPLRITATLTRGPDGRLRAALFFFRKKIPLRTRKRRSPAKRSALLRRLEMPQVRLLDIRAVLRVPEDAAATAQLTGLVRAGLAALYARIRAGQGEGAPLSAAAVPSFGAKPSSLFVHAKFSFRTANLIGAGLSSLKKSGEKRDAPSVIHR